MIFLVPILHDILWVCYSLFFSKNYYDFFCKNTKMWMVGIKKLISQNVGNISVVVKTIASQKIC